MSRATVRRAWRARCRYHLARHKPMRVIRSMRPLYSAETTEGAPELGFAITSQYWRCEACGTRLSDDGLELRNLPTDPE